MLTKVSQTPATEMPLYWFAVLERAVAEGDFDRAADAQHNLRRLGVRVSYGRPKVEEQGVTRDA